MKIIGKSMKILLLTIASISIALLFLSAFLRAIEKTERAECLRWQKEAEEYGKYYLTQWQADQCTAYKIKVEAPIRTQP